MVTILLSVLCLLAASIAVVSWKRGLRDLPAMAAAVSLLFFAVTLMSAYFAGVNLPRIQGEGNYYEIVVAAPVLGKRTLVYAIDLDGNKEKADILDEYPIAGYKIEKIGKRTFLLPMNATVTTTDNRGEIFLVSEDGEATRVPMARKAEGPVNPPLGGPGN